MSKLEVLSQNSLQKKKKKKKKTVGHPKSKNQTPKSAFNSSHCSSPLCLSHLGCRTEKRMVKMFPKHRGRLSVDGGYGYGGGSGGDSGGRNP